MAGANGNRNTAGVVRGAALALATSLLAAAPGACLAEAESPDERGPWSFVADALSGEDGDHAAGEPRSVLSKKIWPELLEAAAPATTQIARLLPKRRWLPEMASLPTLATPSLPAPDAWTLAAMPQARDTGDDTAARCGRNAIGTTRTVTLDTMGGPHYGRHDRYGNPAFLGPKEVVLTFDDGPRPGSTRSILKTLEKHCAKATFFVIGRTALWQPEILRETAAAGHTIAAHTSTHPIPFDGLTHQAAMREIDKGFEQVERALGKPIAPFFRFPGLAYTKAMLRDLSARDVSAFSVDVISDDTARDATPALIVSRTMKRLERYGNGILLFHDTLKRTAAALPILLDRLKAEGYRVVHIQPADSYLPPQRRKRVQMVASAETPAETGAEAGVGAGAGAGSATGPRARMRSQAAPTPWRTASYGRPSWRDLKSPEFAAIY